MARLAPGIGIRQLVHRPRRTGLTILGVTAAVLLLCLLTGLGYGVTQAGTEAITYLEPDLWATASGDSAAGGIHDAHRVTDDLAARPGVNHARAMHFNTIYVGSNASAFVSVVGVGVTAGNRSGAFTRTDPHYAGGTYEGPTTGVVVLSSSAAERLGVSTGEEVHLGGTVAGARNRSYTVIRISDRFSTFLGAPSATVYLSELQEMTGETPSDRATMVGLSLAEDADRTAVRRGIERDRPSLAVRTGQEQLRVVVQNQGAVLASTLALVVVAVLSGTALVGNTLAILVADQRNELAALRAVGLSNHTLGATVGVQGAALGAVGGACGVALTPFAALALNGFVERLVGFPDLIKTPWWVFALGLGIAVAMGLGGALLAVRRVTGVDPATHLRE